MALGGWQCQTQPWRAPVYYLCYSTPRISLDGLKPRVEHCVLHRQLGARRGAVRVVCTGGGAGGWVYRVGYYPSTPHPVPSQLHWYCQGPTTDPYRRYRVPAGTPGPLGLPHTCSSRTHGIALLRPIRARFRVLIS